MNEDEYVGHDSGRTAGHGNLSRREFLQSIGGGIIVFFFVGDSRDAEAQRRFGRGMPEDFNAYLRIGEDGRVTCFTGKIEMGQGIITSLAQMLADELDVGLESVDMVMGDTSVCPWDMGTFGSMSTRFFGPPLRAAGAEARGVLIELAAEHLNVAKDRLQAKDGVISDKTQGSKRVTYGELAKGKTVERHLEEEAVQKTPSQFQVMGKSFNRVDSEEKVTGKAWYAGDVRLPGMLYAKLLRPPAHGARLSSVDTSAAEKREGVQVVRDGDLVAVLHKHPDEAEKALAQVKPQWNVPEAEVDDESIFDHLMRRVPEGDEEESNGDIGSGETLADTVVEETYLNSYVAHATMETHTALARIEGNKATVWASTQTPFRLKEEVAEVLELSSENVRVITPFVGGGFGGKSRNSQAVEAARLAKLTGKPVQVAWSRAEEFFYDSFRPAAVVKIKSGVADSGRIVLWDYGVYYAGGRGAEFFYDAPHYRTTVYGGWGGRGGANPHPFATGAWRAPSNNTNTFARELHMNIMAAKAGMDPVDFRLKNLKDERMIGVLKAVADKSGWVPSKTPSGRGLGVACGIDSETYVATVAEVEVDEETGNVQVKRVVCAQEMGIVINPEGAIIQVEGCVTMGLGYALTEEVRFKGGDVLDKNFDTYQLPRFSWVPKIETVLVKADDIPPKGGGEPAIIVMGGVLASAIFDATGARVLQLPMTPARVKAAVARRAEEAVSTV
jgi:isoquinoline 1-oxidoreductase